MSQDDRQMRFDAAFDFVKFSMADSAACDAQQNFAWSWNRLGMLDQVKGSRLRIYIHMRL
jgi:hypothetical protein